MRGMGLALGLALGASRLVCSAISWELHRPVGRGLLYGLLVGLVLESMWRRDASRPPLPPLALAAVRPLHRALASVAITGLVAGAGVFAVGVLAPPIFAHGVTWEFGTYFAAVGMTLVAGAAGAEALGARAGGRRGRDLVPLVLLLVISVPAFLAGALHWHWWWRDSSSWPALLSKAPLELAAGILNEVAPLLPLLGLCVLTRLRGVSSPGVAALIVVGGPALFGLTWLVAGEGRSLVSFGLAADLLVVLPLALRLGDAVGPGPRPLASR